MKRTPLYESHRALGARMVEFAGWEMPLQFSGILEEHQAVRTRAGLFDVSHMGEIEVRGPRALEVCQRLTVNDVSRLRDGQAQYSVVCLPAGGIVDDVIVYRLSETRYLFCVNAGNRDVDYAWMREHGRDAEVIDRGDEFAQLALQGPRALTILSRLTKGPIWEIPSFGFIEDKVAGRRTLIARTGYTGEDGCELYCAPDDAPYLWTELLEAGRNDGLLPAGLGARDTLRLEAALALYGHELTRDTTPLEARLGWVVKFDKGEFVGRDALLAQKRAGVARRLVGLRATNAGIPRQWYRVFAGDREVGVITSGTKSPTLGVPIALAYVASEHAATGSVLAVEIRGRKIAAEVVALPFYKRPLTAVRDQ